MAARLHPFNRCLLPAVTVGTVVPILFVFHLDRSFLDTYV